MYQVSATAEHVGTQSALMLPQCRKQTGQRKCPAHIAWQGMRTRNPKWRLSPTACCSHLGRMPLTETMITGVANAATQIMGRHTMGA